MLKYNYFEILLEIYPISDHIASKNFSSACFSNFKQWMKKFFVFSMFNELLDIYW